MYKKRIKKTIVIITLAVAITILLFTMYSIANNNKEINYKQQENLNKIEEVKEKTNEQKNELTNETLNNSSNIIATAEEPVNISQEENSNQSIQDNNKGQESNVNTSSQNTKETNKINQENTETVNTSKFDSTVAFIGDSRTQGLIMYNGLKNVQDYSYIGLMVDTAVTKKFVKTKNGNKITILEDMKSKDIKKVYIMLGVNELGWSYPQVFKVKYEGLIDEIRKVKPDCQIFLQSIIPVTKSKSNSDSIYNNTNITKFNEYIKEVAKEKNVKYLDVKSALIDREGNLPENASTDGIHVGKKYCQKWLKYLEENS